MKKKDIIVVVICAIIILCSVYFIMKGLLFKSQESPQATSQSGATFTGKIDEDAINKIKERKDYGSPAMDNIGRDNPFASL